MSLDLQKILGHLVEEKEEAGSTRASRVLNDCDELGGDSILITLSSHPFNEPTTDDFVDEEDLVDEVEEEEEEEVTEPEDEEPVGRGKKKKK
jgi:hypothetical protein